MNKLRSVWIQGHVWLSEDRVFESTIGEGVRESLRETAMRGDRVSLGGTQRDPPRGPIQGSTKLTQPCPPGLPLQTHPPPLTKG